MGFEKADTPSPEEMAKIEKERTLSDAELIKEGAEYEFDSEGNKVLKVTESQIEEKIEENNKIEKQKEVTKEKISESLDIKQEKIENVENNTEGTPEKNKVEKGGEDSKENPWHKIKREDPKLFEDLKEEDLKWGSHYNNFGYKVKTVAKTLQNVVGIGGGAVAALSFSASTLHIGSAALVGETASFITGGLISMPAALPTALVALSAVGIGEAIKMFRRYKERKIDEKKEEAISQFRA